MDMLVRLYDVKDDPELMNRLSEQGIFIKKAMAGDLTKITIWVQAHFGRSWADECTAALLKGGCWIAEFENQVVGFACYDATLPDFFGPTGVIEHMRGKGIGRALLIRSMISMREKGYAYAIIGWTGPQEFYRKVVGATPIEGSFPGAYRNMVGINSAEDVD